MGAHVLEKVVASEWYPTRKRMRVEVWGFRAQRKWKMYACWGKVKHDKSQGEWYGRKNWGCRKH